MTTVEAVRAQVALDAAPLIASALATDLAVTQVRFQYRSTGVIATAERTDQLDDAAPVLLDVFQAAGWGFSTRFATGCWIRVAIKFVHPSQLTLTGAPTPPFPPR